MCVHPSYQQQHPLYYNTQDNKYLVLPYAEKTWQWRGHRITYAEAGLHDAPPIVMVHGFGASAGHFRKLIQLLSLDYHVLAVDLLGMVLYVGVMGVPGLSCACACVGACVHVHTHTTQ